MIKSSLFSILRSPHISEKATLVGDKNNQYVFQVAPNSTKPLIKAAIEALFEVDVVKVNVLNRAGKSKRTMKGVGRRSSIKKAYVTLKSGQEIEFLAGSE